MGMAVRRRSRKRRTTRRRRTTKRRTVRRRARRRVTIRGSRSQVWRGTKQKTKSSGMTKSQLMKNKRGKIVSKKAHAAGLRKWKRNGLSKWAAAFKQARKNLGVKGFKPIKKGTALYRETKRIYNA